MAVAGSKNADFFTTDMAIRVAIDLVAMITLLFGLYYYRRHRDKELATAASMFNIFVFGVLTVLSTIEFSVTASFGLFGILALFTLRSERIPKLAITYFLGSIAIAVICSVNGTALPMAASVVGQVVAGAYLMDHPRVLRAAHGVKILLDKIVHDALSDPERMKTDLSARLGVAVMSYRITALDNINDTARISTFYRKP
jgi:hypothetical protein